MGFLDRLKPQPRWKHQDADVRLAAVRELPDDRQDVLASIAADDVDAHVRRLAAGRLRDPAVLATLARVDADESVRAEACGALLGLALEPVAEDDEAGAPARAAAAVDALAAAGAQRDLVTIARSARSAEVRRAALARLTDVRALAGVARQAEAADVRMQALARVADPAELAGIASRSEHKDVALGALERLVDRALLEEVAERARQKPVARRARLTLQALEARAGRQRRRLELCASVEALAAAQDPHRLAQELAAAEAEWEALAAQDAEPAPLDGGVDAALAAAEHAGEPPPVERFDAAREAARARRAALEAEREARRQRAEALAQAIVEREAMCARVEALAAEGAADRLAVARAEWEGLPPLDEEAGDRREALQRRFEAACRTCEERVARLEAEQRLRTDLERLCDAAEAAAEGPDLQDAAARIGALRAQWATRVGITAEAREAHADLAARLDRTAERLGARQAAAREEDARRRQEALDRLRRQCERIEQRAAAPDLTLKDAERALREAKSLADPAVPLPSRRDHDQLAARFKAAAAALYPRVQELREIDRWQQWANVGVQEALCARVEALRQEPNPEAVARQLREIVARWAQVTSVPPERAEELRRRFTAAHDEVRAVCDAHYARLAEERGANLARKVALCERVEARAESTDWIRTAEEIKKLQAEWQTVGPAPHRQAKALWKRFRAACDRFFTRRKEDLARRKHEWAANLQRKETLCARAEELAEATDWDHAASELRRLQAEWKTIGPVRKNRSEAIWTRFRTACDRFFERYRHRDQIELAGRVAEREALCAELEALVPAAPAGAAADAGPDAGEAAPPEAPAQAREAPADLAEHVRSIRSRWAQAPSLATMPRALAGSLAERFGRGLERMVQRYPESFRGTDLDPGRSRDALEQLCDRVESLLARLTPSETAASPAEILARRWREALAANTMGARADEQAEWRAAAEAVKDAQAAWRKMAPVPGDQGRQLASRFKRACDRFFDEQRRHAGATPPRKTTAAGR